MPKKPVKKKVKRILLGVGHPWFLGNDYDKVCLTAKNASTPMDAGGPIPLKFGNLGAWKKVRLIAEVLE